MKDLILNPDKFFKEIANKPTNLKVPILIILFASMAISLNSILFIIYLPEPSGMNKYFYLTIMFIALFVMFFLYLSILWLVIAGISHIALIKLFNGVGNFKKMIEVVGYVNIPILVGLSFNIILQILGYWTNTSYKIMDAISTLSFAVICIWEVLLFAKGIQYTYNLSFKKSLIIPIFTFLLIAILNTSSTLSFYGV
ncbi:Yip1 family protein [Methanotorris formicicus]|uniref:Yip1 domain-containing protein n=1 Tax=Methanotorris formicicus Mc-S-70 TaxID=647171 RepID=H1L0X3_9EURY|nr:Yip1 family protein [Methanotorris formicicus]EHP84333.1 hypothetical protein MetfoDRAFT_1697 [Methanotorris formicicus Mc-S-70]